MVAVPRIEKGKVCPGIDEAFIRSHADFQNHKDSGRVLLQCRSGHLSRPKNHYAKKAVGEHGFLRPPLTPQTLSSQ